MLQRFLRFADLGFNRPATKMHGDFCSPDGQSISWPKIRRMHAAAVHENAILGMEITRNQNVANLADLAMPVANPGIDQRHISILVSPDNGRQLVKHPLRLASAMILDR